MNCPIEKEYIKAHKGKNEKKRKNTLVFTNELPNGKRILKGKKRGKKVGVLFYGGLFIKYFREWAYIIVGGFINPK
jgi:hypothetical protein